MVAFDQVCRLMNTSAAGPQRGAVPLEPPFVEQRPFSLSTTHRQGGREPNKRLAVQNNAAAWSGQVWRLLASPPPLNSPQDECLRGVQSH